jgi:2,5-furandicarboxylate decarboxylase 1
MRAAAPSSAAQARGALMSNADVLDTRFRSALRRMAEHGRLRRYQHAADPALEIAAIMKAFDDVDAAILFGDVLGFDMPVIGNMLSNRGNCEAAFGRDFRAIREFIARAITTPLPPVPVERAPAHEEVHRDDFDITRALPVLTHTPGDGGRFITAGVVIARDPETGVYNASYHRIQLLGPRRTAIRLDYGRHLRLAWERAKQRGQPLPIAICIGTDIALQYTAATMGSQMPETADEIAVAGGLAGRPLPVIKAVSQDLLLPAETEIVLEGVIRHDNTVVEGPFGEFIGYMAQAEEMPTVDITAFTHRRRPIYHAINGYGRETIMLRKYVLEASLLKVLRAAVPIVVDAEMTAGGLHRFHAVLQIKRTSPAHEGLQRNAILAAFGALKDLDMVIVVDHDIDIRNPQDVEYALATRMEAARDLIVIPEARGHEYVRAGNQGVIAKLGIDATVPFAEQARFARCAFAPTAAKADDFSGDAATIDALLDR